MTLDILSSVLLASSIARVLARYIIDTLGINLFTSTTIPGFSAELAVAKSYDILDFILTVGLTATNFVFFRYVINNKNRALSVIYLLFSLILFTQINFGFYSFNVIMVLMAAFYASLLAITKLKIKLELSEFNQTTWHTLSNGILVGIYLLILINNFTTTLFPLLALVLVPMVYVFIGPLGNIRRSPGHLILSLAIFVPTNSALLLLLGAVSGVLAFLLRNKNLFAKTSFLYPVIFVVIAAYNPLYFLGHLDSVEEGFWLGWLSGLQDGKVLYRDIAAYHPPMIVWIINAAQSVIGASIENTRLVLHILQVVGMVMYYALVSRVLDKKLSRFVVLLVALSLTAIMVRNNVEFRLGVGLLSLALLPMPLLAGAVAALSALTSVEVGVSAAAATLAVLMLSSKRLPNVSKYLLGVSIVALPVAIYFLARGALLPAITQITFYAKAFSEGYFNLPIDRGTTSAFIHWHFVNQYVSAYPFYWELARGAILVALCFIVSKFKPQDLQNKHKIALALAIFGLLVFRSAMGRSDYYHLLFPLLVALPLLFYTLETINKKYLVPIFSILLVFVFFRNIVHASFIEAKLYGLQTYGRIVGETEQVLTPSQRDLVEYLKNNTNADQPLFVFPWNPEVYFLSDRPNATAHYTPYGFFDETYQKEMVAQIESTKPVIIYNPEMKFANLAPGALEIVNSYILSTYSEVTSFGDYKIWTPKD